MSPPRTGRTTNPATGRTTNPGTARATGGRARRPRRGSRGAPVATIIGVVIAALVVLLLIVAFRPYNPANDLPSIAAQVNAKLPMMVDDQTRFDRVTTADHTLIYHFTFVSLSADDLHDRKDAITAKAISNVKANQDTRLLLVHGITVSGEICDRAGTPVVSFTVHPDDL
jgi:hypothetical protein